MECKRLENFRLNFNGKILYIAKWHKCFVGFLFYFCFLAFWYGCFFDRKDERLSNLYQTLYDEVPEGRFYSEELSGNNRFQNFLNKFPYYVFCVLKETIKFFLSNFDGFLKGWVFLLDSFFFFFFQYFQYIITFSPGLKSFCWEIHWKPHGFHCVWFLFFLLLLSKFFPCLWLLAI